MLRDWYLLPDLKVRGVKARGVETTVLRSTPIRMKSTAGMLTISQEDAPAVLNICYALFGIVKITMILICAFSGFMCIYAGFPVWPMYTMIGITLVGIGVCVVKIMKYR